MQVFPITAAFCAFVVFNNLSLQANGVSFYQLMKILTTPAVVVLQLLFYDVSAAQSCRLFGGEQGRSCAFPVLIWREGSAFRI